MPRLHLDTMQSTILIKRNGVLPSLIDERRSEITHTIRMLDITMHIAHHYLVAHTRREVHGTTLCSQGQGDTDPRRHVAIFILPRIAHSDTPQSSRIQDLCHECHLRTGITDQHVGQCRRERNTASPWVASCSSSLRCWGGS